MATTPSAPPPVGYRTLGALFLALVAGILGAMPGWKLCFAAWLVLSWLVLGCVIAGAAMLAIAAVVRRDWTDLRGEGRQMLCIAVLMLAMPPMGLLSFGVELASAHASLITRAEASSRAGGPAIAMTPTSNEDWPVPTSGFVYDRDGVLATPPARRPDTWRNDPVLAALAGECVRTRHVFGPYWRWSGTC